MTTTPTAATPEELAAQTAASLFDGTIITESRLAASIAAAIRQHSAPLEAQIAELTAKLQATDAAHYDATEGISATLQSDALEAAEARATQAEAALSDLPRLIAVVRALTCDPMDGPLTYTLADCIATLEEHEQAVAGIGWQIGLTGETERADRAEKAVTHHATSASRYERLWRAAMRGAAKHRAALSAMTAERDEAKAVADAYEGLVDDLMGATGTDNIADAVKAAVASVEAAGQGGEVGNG
ncbi:hypothetical protein M5E06_10520 [Azospirillum sp. A1-3]|uniref:hypothetical protein n=1 Tax=Azospirillum sp. A1-3 TaxID=185874 RepID=UPI002077815B|nr:hypothetical protein [Azospirillum sp. A1-3]MCM8734628.1 hypothetical protein [Azospirillum sp. A1-3]